MEACGGCAASTAWLSSAAGCCLRGNSPGCSRQLAGSCPAGLMPLGAPFLPELVAQLAHRWSIRPASPAYLPVPERAASRHPADPNRYTRRLPPAFPTSSAVACISELDTLSAAVAAAAAAQQKPAGGAAGAAAGAGAGAASAPTQSHKWNVLPSAVASKVRCFEAASCRLACHIFSCVRVPGVWACLAFAGPFS